MKNGILVPKNLWMDHWRSDILEIYTQDGTCRSSNDLHRLDGPAIVYSSNTPSGWYVDGWKIYDWDDLKKDSKVSDEQLAVLILKYGKI